MGFRPNSCHLRGGLFGLLLMIHTAHSAPLESLDDLAAAAHRFLQRQVPDATVTVQPPDRRLRLTACGEPLEIVHQGGRDLRGVVTLALRCRGPVPWTTYVQATVRREITVVVAARRLERATRLTAADLALAPVDEMQLRGGYLTDLNAAIGQELQRIVTPGRVIDPRHLNTPQLVNKGATVTLRLVNGPISIAVDAVALDAGRLDDTIRVRNVRSGRVLSARVRGPNQVDVSPR